MSAPGKSAAAYLRVSSSQQARDDRDGYVRQAQAVTARAKAMGLVLVAEFRDDISGTTPFHERPALMDALAFLQSNGCRILIAERADRFARDPVELELLLREARRTGVRIVEAETGRDLASDDSPTAVLIARVLGAVAAFERAILTARMRAARDRIRSAGGHAEGPLAFGSDPARPHEAALLDRVRELRRRVPNRRRPTLAAIAASLNGEGHQTRSGLPWTAERLGDVLRA